MKIARIAKTIAVSGILTMALPGLARGADASIENTGPDSHNEVTIEQTNEINVSNHNNVSVTDTASQEATSGEASVEDNTTAGDATSGDATNNSTTTTTVTVTNSTPVEVGGGGGGSGGGGGGGETPGTTTVGGRGGATGGLVSTTGGMGGGELVAVQTLPNTGPSSPVDVSRFLQAYDQQQQKLLSGNGDAQGWPLRMQLTIAALVGLAVALATEYNDRRKKLLQK